MDGGHCHNLHQGKSFMTATTSPTNGKKSILVRIAELRAWLFLIFLAIFFETWSRTVYGTSFVFNIYNLQSISVFATAPLMLALGQTFVIISAGIDLSLGFHHGTVLGGCRPPGQLFGP